MKLLDQIKHARLGGQVERAHGIPHNGSYSNAAHQWGVAILMYYLWPKDFPRLAAVCLTHDVPEAWVGDVPATTMRYVPGLKAQLGEIEEKISAEIGIPIEHNISEDDYAKLKACDRLELYLWCIEQMYMGNLYPRSVIIELNHFFSTIKMPAEAERLLAEIQAQLEGDGYAPAENHGVIRRIAKELWQKVES